MTVYYSANVRPVCPSSLWLILGCGIITCALAARLPAATPVAPSTEPIISEDAARESLADSQPQSGLVRWAGFEFFPRASAQMIYNDNLTIQPRNQLSDLLWSLSPGVMILGGTPGVPVPPQVTFEQLRQLPRMPYVGMDNPPAKMLMLDFAPDFRIYTEHSSFDTIDYAGFFSGIYGFSRLTVGLDQDFTRRTDTVADVRNLITAEELTTRLTLKYDLSDRTCVEVNGRFRDYSYEDPRFFGSRQWANMNWINRQLSGKLNAGLGVTIGYWDIDRSPSQTYEQVLARAIYRVGQKLDFTASAGGEWRQFGGGAADALNPVFSLSGTYAPVSTTSLTLEGHQTQQTSIGYSDQNYTETGFSLSVRQQVLDRFAAILAASYYITDYSATDAQSTVSREDHYYTIRLTIEVPLSARWVSSVFYEHRGDDTGDAYAWSNNRAGLKVTWRF